MERDLKGWDIVDQVIGLLKFGGAVSQEPYQAFLYRLCRAAHDGGHTYSAAHPRLTGDGLVEAILERWPDAENDRERLRDLSTVWRAWLYALAHP